MKALTIAGRVTRDAEIRTTNGGDKLASFSVAVDDRSGKDKTTLFFDCTLFGRRGEALAQYLTKGSSVCVSGDFGTRDHNGKTYLTLRANDVTLQGGKPQDDGQSFRGGRDGGVSGGGGGAPLDYDDSIPFVTCGGIR